MPSLLKINILPFELIVGSDGRPLDGGFIYIGEPFKDPEQYPIQVYWDDDKTIPALQPIRTLNGFVTRNGTSARIYIEQSYSIKILSANRVKQFYAAEVVYDAFATQGDILDLKNVYLPSFGLTAFNGKVTSGSVLDVRGNGLYNFSTLVNDRPNNAVGQAFVNFTDNDNATIFYGADDKSVYFNTKINGVWNGWVSLSETTGQVAAFAMQTAPNGWLPADGAAVSRATYANLFARIGTTYGAGDGSTTFNVPDARGEFVRGWDGGKGIDANRAFGSWQDQDVQPHNHPAWYSGLLMGEYGPYNNYVGSAYGGNSTANVLPPVPKNTGTETRPRNIALLYCIKY